MTVFALNPLVLTGGLLSTAALIICIYKFRDHAPLPSHSSFYGASPEQHSASASIGIDITPLPAITVYRAHMLLMTFLAILAVDFPIFPRSLAKCESFGVSLVWFALVSSLWVVLMKTLCRWTLESVHLCSPKGLYRPSHFYAILLA